MGLLEFNKLPINTLVGADWKTFKAITAMEPRWKANGILLSSNGIFLYMPDQFPFPQ